MNNEKIKRYPLLLVHLVISVCILGTFFIYIFNLPFLILSRWFRWARDISGFITQMGLKSLRVFQPWWKGELSVKLPADVLSGQRGCLCVANHRSHIDVFLLLEQIRSVRVLTKHLIFLIPGLGFAAHLLRMIRVRRGDVASFCQSMDEVEKALSSNEVVHVFPEMTRSDFSNTKLSRFVMAPFQKAISTKAPVVPIVIWGTDYLWPKGVYAIASGGPLVVKSLPPVESTHFSSASDLCDFVKNQIQEELDRLKVSHPYPGEL